MTTPPAPPSSTPQRPPPDERITKMVASGAISPEQGAALLSALNQPAQPSRWRWLVNPFPQLSTRTSAALIGLSWLLQLLLTRGGIVFDGALDVHTVAQPARWSIAALQLTLAMGIPIVVFSALSRLLGARPRLIDMATAVALARSPLLLLALASMRVHAATLLQSPWQLAAMAVVALATLAWLLVLLFQGVRWASGLAGGRVWLLYLVGLMLAEAIAWGAIHSLLA